MRWIRILAWLGAAILMVYVGLLVWMNRVGARDWRSAQEALDNEGVELDFKSTKGVVAVPDENNFCAIPIFKGLGTIEDGDPEKGEPAAKRKALEDLGLPKSRTSKSYPRISSRNTDMPLDLREWADWLRTTGHTMPITDPDNAAREVFEVLSYQDAAIAEMVAALDRPVSRLTPDWRLGPFPDPLVSRSLAHLSALQSIANGLSLRIKAAAQAGEDAKAHEAALCLARVAEAACEEPHAIGLLVGVTFVSILSQSTWEMGLARSGTAEEFLRLQRALERFDIRSHAVRAFKEELVLGVDAAFFMQRQARIPAIADQGAAQKLVLLVPRGWFESNAAHVATLSLEHLVLPLRDLGWSAALVESERMENRIKDAQAAIWRHPGMILPSMLLPSSTRIVDRAAYAQSYLDHAIIACALERFRLERGTYPELLTELARAGEKPLPVDILSGKPMGYKKTADDRYVLWAVGFDGTDDGGHRPTTGTYRDKQTNRQYKGDWVWTYPTSEEIAASRVEATSPAHKRPQKRTPIRGTEDPPQKPEPEPAQ